jgi:hypothetical protein
MTLVIPPLSTSGKAALRARKSSIQAATTGWVLKAVWGVPTPPILKHNPRTCTNTLSLVIENWPPMTFESRKWLKAREASHVSVVIFLATSRKTPAHAGETSAPPSAIRTQLVRW